MLKQAYVSPESLPAAALRWEKALVGYDRPAEALRTEHSALLVVDMQAFFLDPESPAYLPAAPAVLPVVRSLAAAARACARPAVFTVYANDGRDPADPMARRWRRPCPPGSRWAALAPELAAGGSEGVLEKPRYSAFRGTALAEWLAEREVSDLIIAGVMTNLCVEATVRDAFELGYSVHVPLDGTAAADEDLHVGSLKTIALGFGRVLRGRELAAELAGKQRSQEIDGTRTTYPTRGF